MSKFEKLFSGKFKDAKEITFTASEKEAYLMFEKNQGIGGCTLSIKGLSEYVHCLEGDAINPNQSVQALSLIKGCEYKLTLSTDYALSQRKEQGEAFISVCYVEVA